MSSNGSTGQVTPGLNNGTSSEQQCTGQVLCSQQCEALHKIALKLHQIECGQRKIIQLLLNLDKELSAKEKSGSHCSKHSSSNQSKTGWVREEESIDGERLVKIQLQDATTSTKHVGFRIDKSCQTSTKDNTQPQCEACKGHNQEMAHLQEELKKATAELAKTFEGSSQVDLGSESPLNLFIQCFQTEIWFKC